MKRTVKPVVGETLSAYWLRCNGSFAYRWDLKALKYSIKNGATVEMMVIVAVN